MGRLVFFVRNFVIFYCLLLGSKGFGQILDDSTVLVYGPSTLNVITEDHLKRNRQDLVFIDTTLNNLENFSIYDQSGHKFQDLGNLGTAMFPVFYDLPNVIGAKSGYSAFDPLTILSTDVKYYNTKSPFMQLNVFLGSHDRSYADLSFSQNVNQNWNVGFDFFRSTADKQIGTEKANDRNAINSVLQFYTHYEHPTIPYKLLFNFISFSNQVDETGGIFFNIADSLVEEEDRFLYQNNSIWLQNARTDDKRSSFHLYQEYDLLKNFEVYHQLDQQRKTNNFSDFRDSKNNGGSFYDYYDQFLIDKDSLYMKSVFRSFSNEIGLKGEISSVFYRFYVRNRVVDQHALYYEPMTRKIENYLGGVVDFRLKELFEVEGKVELMQTGEYFLSGVLRSELVNIEYRSMYYQQSSLSQRFVGNPYEWSNSFDNTFANELNASIKWNWWKFQLIPKISLTSYSNYVYFDFDKLPSIAPNPNLVTKLGGNLNLFLPTNKSRKSGFHFENEFIYTTVSGNQKEVFLIPKVFMNIKGYWEGSWFKNTIPVQIGLDLHHRSAYNANAYDPVIQQFYLQDEKQVFYGNSYPINVFWNMRIEKIFIFLKCTHVNQPTDGGYMVTPGYPGQQRSFLDFGFKWLFFD